jgi:hypothetical protein
MSTYNPGVIAPPVAFAVSVTTATTVVLAKNLKRTYALIQNDTAAAIYLGIGQAAILNKGIRLNANGGSYEMSMALNNLSTDAVNAIGSGTGICCGVESS